MPNFFKKHYINDILFYEPKIFNEKVALSCRLFPFTRQKLQLLAVMDIIVGEIGSKRSTLQKKYPKIKIMEERPRKYYFTESTYSTEIDKSGSYY